MFVHAQLAAMTDSRDCSIVKIPLAKPPNKFIILKTTWSSDSSLRVDILLMNADYPSITSADEYTGCLWATQIDATAMELGISVDDVIAETRKALRTDGGSKWFSYELESNQFRWFTNGTFKMVYGTIDLETTYGIGADLFLTLMQLKSEYKAKYDGVRNELEATKSHHEQIQKTYEQFVAGQMEKEEQTLAKFLALLNTKKAKIGYLENLLERVSSNGGEPMDMLTHDAEEESNGAGTSGTSVTVNKILRKRTQAKVVNEVKATQADVSAATTSTSNNDAPDPVYSKDTQELCGDV